ncbi:MAG: VOC family protein [Gammaproteobacteria bacterium]|nr:VOC family protein [Gammaproteobacteria bacterium]
MKVCRQLITGGAIVLTLLFAAPAQGDADPGDPADSVPLQRATIVVGDLDTAIAFYRDALGLPLIRVLALQGEATRESLGLPETAQVRFATLGSDADSPGQLGLLEITDAAVATATLPAPPQVGIGQVLLVWRVDDAVAARTRVLAAGATLITDIKAFTNRAGRELVIAAPDGTRIQLVELGD